MDKKIVGRITNPKNVENIDSVITVSEMDGEFGKEICFTSDRDDDFYFVVDKEQLLQFLKQ